jgi:hypothetical protein
VIIPAFDPVSSYRDPFRPILRLSRSDSSSFIANIENGKMDGMKKIHTTGNKSADSDKPKSDAKTCQHPQPDRRHRRNEPAPSKVTRVAQANAASAT